MPEIKLPSGDVLLVDTSDAEMISTYTWWVYTDKTNGCKYAKAHTPQVGHKRGKDISAHRLIMQARPEQMVDHVNGNGLDNRRENLRFSSPRENQSNQARHRQGGLVGAQWHSRVKKWRCSITVDGCAKHLGYYNTPEEAHHVYELARWLYV